MSCRHFSAISKRETLLPAYSPWARLHPKNGGTPSDRLSKYFFPQQTKAQSSHFRPVPTPSAGQPQATIQMREGHGRTGHQPGFGYAFPDSSRQLLCLQQTSRRNGNAFPKSSSWTRKNGGGLLVSRCRATADFDFHRAAGYHATEGRVCGIDHVRPVDEGYRAFRSFEES